jgi:hypothetical protein
MKLGTWNLQQASPAGVKGQRQAGFIAEQRADVWMLTEVHEAFALQGHDRVTSPGHLLHRPRQRWAAVISRWPLRDCRAKHEGLALARAQTPAGPLLVASSVMPWRGAKTSWPGDPDARHGVRFADSLDQHRGEIERARDGDEPVVWGGDFNQALSGPESAGSMGGRRLLDQAFASVGLTCTTSGVGHLNEEYCAIDHISVSRSWSADTAVRLTPPSSEGKALSDHACYTCTAH